MRIDKLQRYCRLFPKKKVLYWKAPPTFGSLSNAYETDFNGIPARIRKKRANSAKKCGFGQKIREKKVLRRELNDLQREKLVRTREINARTTEIMTVQGKKMIEQRKNLFEQRKKMFCKGKLMFEQGKKMFCKGKFLREKLEIREIPAFAGMELWAKAVMAAGKISAAKINF